MKHFRNICLSTDLYGKNLNFIDLTPSGSIGDHDQAITTYPATHLAGTVARFKDLAVAEAEDGNLTTDQVHRIERFGMNAYEDNEVEDEEEHWHTQAE